ncbi:E3 ubiquitin-protein ligase UPL7 [Iris pallida]|uniref:HECT-type E3 ubiquitin transferase n=2 Tax=Iris pallida TaxID=29817 RepID=A0AAX6HHI5_IRIPA|nr:E3 ubiquitin-protein ligase UPL7 [Iris pallida]
MSREDLLEKVSKERELRNYNRRASAAALFIQRVWRRYFVMKKVAGQFQEEWEVLATHHNCKSGRWISRNLIRPFLFFTTQSSTLHQKFHIRNVKCMLICFKILLQSMNSADVEENFCSLAMGTIQEKSVWSYQAKKLVLLCSFILAEFDHTSHECEDIVQLTALAMRLAVALTDPKGWKAFKSKSTKDADNALKKLLRFMTTEGSIYICIRRYFVKLGIHITSQKKAFASTDDTFLITATAITLALRPQHYKESDENVADLFDVKDASEQYFIFILTVPYLIKCVPSVLLPALKHKSAMLPCLSILLTSKDRIFNEMLKLEHSESPYSEAMEVSCSGWALANIINLATDYNNDQDDSRCFIQDLDCRLYVQVMNCISENFLNWLESVVGFMSKNNDDSLEKDDSSFHDTDPTKSSNLKSLYMDLLKPVHQQWHLRKLLAMVKENATVQDVNISAANKDFEYLGNFELLWVVSFYYYMLRIFSFLNPFIGSMPILNLLAFTPGFLVELWETLEKSIFHGADHMSHIRGANSGSHDGVTYERKQSSVKETGNKWASILQKISGKTTDVGSMNLSNNSINTSEINGESYDSWDIESMRQGSQGVSKHFSYFLHLFCATYAHLLLVLDDIEFYEKQVPFTLEQQRKIASALNTFVYNSFIHNVGQSSKPLIDVAVRCLHLLYERDCRHKFCPSALWVGPARIGRIPIAAAARAHEAAFTNLQLRDSLSASNMSSVLTVVPHVYPFEERVKMFREFIKLDKVSRRVAGEVSGPGAGSIEIVVRRDRIVEDGYKQLNFLGSRLRSCINVSFISECGLPEAGLDYGGLSKEFLTDLAKAAFNPQYGLFSQTSTTESNLVPNMSARLLDNGIPMIEFLGRVVGKALYEGILLDYSFSLVFVQKLLGRYSFLDELSTLDSELYRNLMYVKHLDGDVEELSLDFTVTEEVCGKRVVNELKPGGRDIPVTNENKLQYVHAMADYKLNRQLLPLANAFYRGLTDLISPSWLSLFNANEFNQLLSGGTHDFDVDDLRSNTRYTGGYSEGSRTVKLFWEVIRGFKPTERCMLLKFVTSCSRAPLLGFQHLQPSFTIHKVACDLPLWATFGGQDVDRLPSASTCYNTLKLPTYKRPSTLRNKLLYAISSNTGFELS